MTEMFFYVTGSTKLDVDKIFSKTMYLNWKIFSEFIPVSSTLPAIRAAAFCPRDCSKDSRCGAKCPI